MRAWAFWSSAGQQPPVFLALAFALAGVPGLGYGQDLDGQAFDCLIEPATVVELGTPVEGIISEVLVERGDTVKAGQVVARLEAKVEAAQLALAQARATDDSAVRSAEARYNFQLRKADRLKELLSRSVGSVAAVEEAEAEAEVAHQEMNEALVNRNLARLDQDRADAVLKLRTILSPIDGVVTEVLIAPGEYRNGQSHLATIAKTDRLHIEVFVSKDYFGRIKKGSIAEIVPDEPIGGIYQGKVTVVDDVLDAKSGTFGVRLDLPNKDHKVPAGSSCRITFPNAR